jgi:hypothetical protein
MLVGDNVVDHAVGGQKSMQPKSIPPGLKAADDTHRRVIRRIQPVAQAGDESKQSCAVARFRAGFNHLHQFPPTDPPKDAAWTLRPVVDEALQTRPR